MLEEQHNRLKAFIFTYYSIWRCDFIPDFNWKILKWIKLSIYPINLIFGLFCFTWHLIYQMEDYGYDLALTIVYTFGTYQCLVVYYEIMINHRERLFAMLRFFDGLLNATSEPLISDIRRKYFLINIELGLKWTRIFLIFITFVGVSVTIYHLKITNYSAPLLLTIPGIPNESIFFYPVNIIYGIFFYFYILIYITSADAVVMIMILYFRSELSAVAGLVTQLNDDAIVRKRASFILRTAYVTHNVSLMKIKELTQTFWHLYFHKLFAIMIYLCCILYIFQSLDSSIFVAILCVGAMTSQIFILCFFGQVLQNSSELLYDAFYMTRWYEMKLPEQKIFLIMLMNLQKPLVISTFGFGDISIYTFVQICKAAGSYAAILYTVLN